MKMHSAFVSALNLLLAVLALAGAPSAFAQSAMDKFQPKCEPPPKDPSLWDKSVAFGLNLTSGNSETLLLNGDAIVSRDYEDNIWLFRLTGNYGEDQNRSDEEGNEDVTTQENISATAGYKRVFWERWFGGAGMDFLYDGIADIDYRLNLKNPWGYFLVKGDAVQLSAEAGPGMIFEKVGGIEDNYFAPRVGERFEWKISETAKLFQTAEVIFDVNDSENYIVNAEAGLEAAINSALALVFSAKDNFDNIPAENRERNDLSMITALKVSL